MAYVETTVVPHDLWRAALESGEYPQTISGGELGGNGAAATTSQTQAAQETYDSYPSVQSSPVGTSVASKNILEPIQGKVQNTSEELQSLGETFRESAGPSRTWASIGGESILGNALNPSFAEQPSSLEEARSLVGAQYGGPTGLDTTAVGNLRTALQDLGTYVGRLGTGTGLQAGLTSTRPQLTRGMARMDVAGLLKNPDFRKSLYEQQGQISGGLEEIGKASKEAEEYAAQRQAEESGIAETAKSKLKSTQTGTLAGIEAEVAKRNAESTAALARMKDALSTGQGLEEFVDVPETEYSKQLTEAKSKLAEIMAKYPTVAQFPVLGRTFAHHSSYLAGPGEPVGGTDIRDWVGVDPATGKTRALTGAEIQALQNRQYELERLYMPGGWGGSAAPAGPEGEYAQVLPLYFGEAYEPSSLEGYVTLDEGNQANLGNTASDEDIQRLDWIADLLGEEKKVMRSEDPWRSATLMLDAKNWLEAENARMAANKENLDERQKKYWNAVRTNIKNWDKQRESESWGPISDILGSDFMSSLGFSSSPVDLSAFSIG